MTRLLPFPFLSLGLLVLWLLLNQTTSLGHILLGSVLALVGGWILMALQLPRAPVRRPAALLQLSFLVLIDILHSNIAVGRIILGQDRQHRTSGFVRIPLDLRNPYGLAALACIITATPGTLWVNFNQPKGLLMIHVLDLIDEDDWIRTIKGRYERRLLEIFP
ncbi:Na+/H+ antiporter subunit E [Bradyrhizobium sp. SYSU BS000235]|uniref:Na+/H+ antiporter subunit E n=1 Tax=Bradyrhizobium sp. SYSU BS000235 TaxID=3411332 RepID=UPI003C70BA6F